MVTRKHVPMLALVALSTLLGASATALAEDGDTKIVAEGVDRDSPLQGFVLNFGIESNWGYLHPGAPGFERSMEAFGFDPIWALFNVNFVGEVLFSLADMWEVGPHFAYNGLFTHTGDGGRDFDLASQEVGVAARLLFRKRSSSNTDSGQAALRCELGYIRSVFTIDQQDEVGSSFFVRPALSTGTVGSGVEFTFGWTFATVPDGFGTSDSLPLGGLDVGLLMRIAP